MRTRGRRAEMRSDRVWIVEVWSDTVGWGPAEGWSYSRKAARNVAKRLSFDYGCRVRVVSYRREV